MSTSNYITIDIAKYGIKKIKRGISISELANVLKLTRIDGARVVGGLYNNRVMGLEYKLRRDCRVTFLTTNTENGLEIYRRSLSLLLFSAFIDTIGHSMTLKIEHSLNRGYFYSFFSRTEKNELTKEETRAIETRMQELVRLNLPFTKYEIELEDALDLFEHIGAWDRYWLIRYIDVTKVTLYNLGDCTIIAQGPLVPNTGYLTTFSITQYPPGLILNFPTVQNPQQLPKPIEQKKLFQIYSEQREWMRILDVDSAGKLNRLIIKGNIDELIWVSEGLHEKKIAQIADIITKNSKTKRIILLAGPSSSGKTTFAKRLTIQLLANGINPVVISLDNYFLPRDRMPRNQNGNIDMESLEAIDVELINEHLSRLLKGETIYIPKYDFKQGTRLKDSRKLSISDNQIVIIEGIHGMNEKLTSGISKKAKFKIYISALTQLNLDYINRIPTSTVRLIRRIVRDSQFRAYSARQTIAQWPSVRAGEDKHIFPFQEEADVMFNSSLVYEMAVLKGYVEPLLKQIEDTEEEYIEAKKLLHFTSNFVYISPDHVPLTSILREFIGGSGFRY